MTQKARKVESEPPEAWADPNVERFIEITAQVIRRRRAGSEYGQPQGS